MHPLPGTYALIFSSTAEKPVGIGKLGIIYLKRGFYIYIGSAFGPGGLKARIRHHLKNSSRPHWHIDYLAPMLKPHEIWYTYDPVRREHQWAELHADARGASIPLPGFGSSDCGCPSHLFFYQSPPSGRYFSRRLRSRFQDHTGFHTAKSKNFLTNSA
jgi:Uri superfamily endonuclease